MKYLTLLALFAVPFMGCDTGSSDDPVRLLNFSVSVPPSVEENARISVKAWLSGCQATVGRPLREADYKPGSLIVADPADRQLAIVSEAPAVFRCLTLVPVVPPDGSDPGVTTNRLATGVDTLRLDVEIEVQSLDDPPYAVEAIF